MKLHKHLIIFLLVASAAHAAPEADLKRAVNRGDAAAVAAALKAGANVNARFEVGKTALMIAAERGRIAAVEALLDAGADMYVRDNNNRDALMAAVDGEQVATVRVLLNRGFDPALNDWRALKIIPEGRRNRADMQSSKQAQLRKILEEHKARADSTRPLVFAAPSRDGAANPPAEIIDNETSVIIDISGKNITPERFKAAASQALKKRGWQISSTEEGRLIGTLDRTDMAYKMAIVLAPPMVKIAYIKGYSHPKQTWLLNIKKDLMAELNAVSSSN